MCLQYKRLHHVFLQRTENSDLGMSTIIHRSLFEIHSIRLNPASSHSILPHTDSVSTTISLLSVRNPKIPISIRAILMSSISLVNHLLSLRLESLSAMLANSILLLRVNMAHIDVSIDTPELPLQMS